MLGFVIKVFVGGGNDNDLKFSISKELEKSEKGPMAPLRFPSQFVKHLTDSDLQASIEQ